MKFANEFTSDGSFVGSVESKFVASSGVGLNKQPAGMAFGG